MFCVSPLVFTIHDLIHLGVPEEGSPLKRSYFKHVVLPSRPACFLCMLTVSEHSKRQILRWSHLPEHRVVVAGNGVDSSFSPRRTGYRSSTRGICFMWGTVSHTKIWTGSFRLSKEYTMPS